MSSSPHEVLRVGPNRDDRCPYKKREGSAISGREEALCRQRRRLEG